MFPKPLGCPILSKPQISTSGQDFYFTCSVNYSSGPSLAADARFRVSFLFNGVVSNVTTAILQTGNTVATLHEYYMQGRMGQYLSCQVETYWFGSDKLSPRLSSGRYWAGIAFSHSIVTLHEVALNSTGDTSDAIYPYCSLPILCSDAPCVLRLAITTPDSVAVIQHRNEELQKCSFTFLGNLWNSTENLVYDPKSPLQVVVRRMAIPSTQYVKEAKISMQAISQLKASDGSVNGAPTSDVMYSPWMDYIPEDITVYVHGGNKRAICRSVSDPHINTFDKRGYFTSAKRGIYWLMSAHVPNTQEIVHIQVMHMNVARWRAAINCAIAVRTTRGEIRVIDYCQGDVKLLRCAGTQHDPITSTPNRKTFYMHTSEGVIVTVALRNLPGAQYLDITVDVPAAFKSTNPGAPIIRGGLCGNFDGQPSNDFNIDPNDGQDDINAFIEAQSIDTNGNSYFTCPNITGEEREFCSCMGDANEEIVGDGTVCGFDDSQLMLGQPPTHVVKTLIPGFVRQNNKQRKRRETPKVEDYTDDFDDEYKMLPFIEPPPGDNSAPPWGTFEVTEQQAEEYCKQIIEGGTSYKLCENYVLDGDKIDLISHCKSDIQRTGELQWADDRDEQYQSLCRSAIIDRVNTSDPLFMTLLSDFLATVCPSNCSGNGVCQNGECNCDSEHIGADCSLAKGTNPTILKYHGPLLCDVRDAPCQSVRIRAENLVDSGSLTCRIEINGTHGLRQISSYVGELLTAETIRCPLPVLFTSDRTDTSAQILAYNYQVSLSNDGISFNGAKHLGSRTVWDSDLMWEECVQNNVYVHQTESCAISGKCYTEGQMLDHNGCFHCSPANSRDGWTQVESSYGVWSSYGECSKDCDYGLRTRARNCTGCCLSEHTKQNILCNTFNCDVPVEELQEGVQITFTDVEVLEIVETNDLLINITHRLLNTYAGLNPDELCEALNLRLTENPVPADAVFGPGSVYIGKGYPLVKDDSIQLKILVELSSQDVTNICKSSHLPGDRTKRSADVIFVARDFIIKALSNLPEELKKNLGFESKIVPEDDSADSKLWVIIGASVGAAVVVVVIVVLLAVKCRRHNTPPEHAPVEIPPEHAPVEIPPEHAPVNIPPEHAPVNIPPEPVYLDIPLEHARVPQDIPQESDYEHPDERDPAYSDLNAQRRDPYYSHIQLNNPLSNS